MNSERIRVWLGFFIVSFVWGSTWLAIKIGLRDVPPFFAAGIRFAIASAVLYFIVRTRRIPIPINRDTRKLYASLAVLSYTVPFALVYWAQQFIPSGLSSILFAAYPFWVAIFSQLVLKNERLNVFKVCGISLGFAGLVVIFSGDMHLSGPNSVAGMVAVLVTTVMQAFSLILVKKYGQPVSPFAMNFVGMLVGGVALLILALFTESIALITWTGEAVGSIAYLALVGSVLTFVTYHWLLKRTEAVYLSLTSFINPIVAVLLGAIVLHETLAEAVFVGAALVLAGLLVANGKQLYAKFVTE